MSLTKEEMLELVEKHNGHVVLPDSQWAKTEPGVSFGELSDFLAFASAIEQKYQAQYEDCHRFGLRVAELRAKKS